MSAHGGFFRFPFNSRLKSGLETWLTGYDIVGGLMGVDAGVLGIRGWLAGQQGA